MSDIAALVSDHLDIWTAATERKNGAGRGGGKRVSLYGIERLRGLILELAVQGELLPQDASDEAASASLVQARKSLSAKANDVRRLRWKPSRPFDAEETGRPVPPGWALARVNDTGFYINGLAFKPSDWTVAGRPIIRIQNLTNPSTPYNYAQGDYPDEVVVRDGDLLVSWSATLAAFQWSGEDAILNQHIFRVIHEPALTERAYLRLMLEHAIAEMADSEHAHGLVMTHINRGPFLDHLVKVPPLAEQRRIVAKVDELMALCDALEGESAAALTAHQTLVETLLATLVNSADAANLAVNWSRLEAHFDTLLTTEASVETLKQTILDLAVRGLLTRADSKDKHVDALIAEIGEHRQIKGKRGRRRLPNALSRAINEADLPFSIPSRWRFIRFQDVLINRDAERVPVSSEERVGRKGQYDYYGASGVIDHVDRYLFDEPLLLIGEDGANLINRSKPIAFIARGKYWVNNHAHVLEAASESLLRYMELFINAIDLKPFVTGTAQPKMNQAKMNSIVVALPPAAEMARIVEKVDALMAICDNLRACIADETQIRMRLADAIVERAAA